MWINYLAKYTFGIYLIHDNPLLRDLIWQSLFETTQYQNSPYILLHFLLCTVIIFITCAFIDFLRSVTVERLWLKMFDRVKKALQRKA